MGAWFVQGSEEDLRMKGGYKLHPEHGREVILGSVGKNENAVWTYAGVKNRGVKMTR